LVPETIEEIQSTIDSFFKSSRDGVPNTDVNYSDDEDDKVKTSYPTFILFILPITFVIL
jgi:hypothetical protein